MLRLTTIHQRVWLMSSIKLADETKLKISLRLPGCPIAGRHDERLAVIIRWISAELSPTVCYSMLKLSIDLGGKQPKHGQNDQCKLGTNWIAKKKKINLVFSWIPWTIWHNCRANGLAQHWQAKSPDDTCLFHDVFWRTQLNVVSTGSTMRP